MMTSTFFNNEIYFCPNCKTSEHTHDWKCPICGNYTHITVKSIIENYKTYDNIIFIRKTTDEIKKGDRVMVGSIYLYEVLNKYKNNSKSKNMCTYILALRNFGTLEIHDNEYINCVIN